MAEDWGSMLEYRGVDVTNNIDKARFAPGVDVKVPAAFGRSEYKRMVDDLWSEGEVRAMTVLDRSIDFLDEAIKLTSESIEGMYDTTASLEFDGDEYALGIFATGLGTAGIGMALASIPLLKAEKGVSHNLQSPLYTDSSTVYDTGAEIGEQESTRIFYRESPEGRSIKFTGPLGEEPDPEIVEEGLEYLESFES